MRTIEKLIDSYDILTEEEFGWGATEDFTINFLDKISNKIVNNVKGINRVVYDISSKPPSTIELE